MYKRLLFLYLISLICFKILSQTYQYCPGDSVHLGLASYSGDLQWQESSDSINWTNINGATFQPYGFVFANNKYYRAKVTLANCNPVYSPVLKAALSTNCSGQLTDTVYCNGTPTTIVDVTNPFTGKIWMDRNLGAGRAAGNSSDNLAYGDYYQWGRFTDGHQCRNAATSSTLSSSEQTGHGNFIISANWPNDWLVNQNTNLWQGINGLNNPCPTDYRVPTEAELNEERGTWSSSNSFGAITSYVKFPLPGFRSYNAGTLGLEGTYGLYWSSTVSGAQSRYLRIRSADATMMGSIRANGYSVRCIKDATILQGSINSIDCNTPTNTGTLAQGIAANNVSSTLAYNGGNGGAHTGQTVNSTGVNGLTATLAAGNFASGDSTLTYSISGTPDAIGTANFSINIGGQTCTLNLNVYDSALVKRYPAGSVFCASGPTQIVDVVNPVTGRTWMDRNLGASRAAQSSTDSLAYGDLYQWGRFSDGHQCRNSETTSILSSSDQPGHGKFILAPNAPHDWRSPQNDNLWQGANGVNNPCPVGYRVPTETELNNERASWGQVPISSSNSIVGAFASPLKLPTAYSRYNSSGGLYNIAAYGFVWSSTFRVNSSNFLYFNNSEAGIDTISRASSNSIRCIKDEPQIQGSINSIDCNTPTNIGTLVQGVLANNVSSTIAYTGGNGGAHNGQTVNSTGVNGLTATLAAGNFNNGDSTLTYMISGTPDSIGTASFAINIGGQTCSLDWQVGLQQGLITQLLCDSTTYTGRLMEAEISENTSCSIKYIGGNGGVIYVDTIISEGVLGLKAILEVDTLAIGDGSIAINFIGTPASSGTATFLLNIGGQSCSLNTKVYNSIFNLNLNYGSLTDQDGNTYKTIQIGSQTWMAENLRTTKYRNGENLAYFEQYIPPTPPVLNENYESYLLSNGNGGWINFWDTYQGSWSYFNNDPNNNKPYGKLYDWYSAASPKNICPSGWHLPLESDWNKLMNYVGSGEVGAIKLTSRDTNFWDQPNQAVTNETGFSAISGGLAVTQNNIFWNDKETFWWSLSDRFTEGSYLTLPNKFCSDSMQNLLSTNPIPGGYNMHNLNFISPIGSAIPYNIINDQDLNSSLTGNSPIGNSYGKHSSFPVRCIKDDFIATPDSGIVNCLDCGSTNQASFPYFNGTLKAGETANNVSFTIAYSGGNGGKYPGETLQSFDVKGLTATLLPDTFALGCGILTYSVTGMPSSSGYANFIINVGGKFCLISLDVSPAPNVFNENLVYGSLSDASSNTYKTIEIGSQTWMAEDLRTTKFRNGEDITSGLIQNYDGTNYNWSAVSDIRKICPDGWHIPSNSEWDELFNYLGGTVSAGSKLRSVSKWRCDNYFATNSSGFSAVPNIYIPALMNSMDTGRWWTDTEFFETSFDMMFQQSTTFSNNAYSRYLLYSDSKAYKDSVNKIRFLSVRCIKDDQLAATSEGRINSILCGDTTNTGVIKFGFMANGVSSTIHYTGGNGGVYEAQTILSTGITGLTATLASGNFDFGSGTITFQITGAADSIGYANFSITIGHQSCTLSVMVIDSASIFNPNLTYGSVSDIDSNTYKTIQIGNQIWMAENLRTSKYNDGIDIPNISGYGEWLTNPIGRFCYYNNDENNNARYGKLYNAYAVNRSNLCPSGWHVPSDNEWTILTDYLGGEIVAGGKMKSVSSQFWENPNSTATNESGFSGLPSGYRYWENAAFYNIGNYGTWWSSTPIQDSGNYYINNLWYRQLAYNNGSVERAYGHFNNSGLAIRCIKDETQTQGSIISIDCNTPINTGTLVQGVAANNVSSKLAYTLGNGGTHNGQTVNSTGVTGLTATLAAGNFKNGDSTLTYLISGTPDAIGTASFAINIGGQNCTLNVFVFESELAARYTAGSVFCSSGPTQIVDVTSPTGRIWMDRNLGASQAATSSTDAAAYGDLYQWGRAADGHQCRNSSETTILSSTDKPEHGNFIISDQGQNDWRNPENPNLWQGVNGVNNPCPIGYRLPSILEFNAEKSTWISQNTLGAFSSSLKLTLGGGRICFNGNFERVGLNGYYWTSSVNNSISQQLYINDQNQYDISVPVRATAYSIRCIKD